MRSPSFIARLPSLREIEEEQRRRAIARERESHTGPGGLIRFIRYFWRVLEPSTPFVDGWALEALCEHLEAITFGHIQKLLANVPPGFMKSLTSDVFWPAWEWGPMNMAHLRYVAFSYSVGLTERDNGKFRDLLLSSEFQEMYGDRVVLRKVGETLITNTRTGVKRATSVGGIGTGERGDRIILDDPHNVKDSESDAVREETVRWFREALSNRMNNIDTSAIVVIMQRVHEADVSGTIIEADLGYEHLMIPMEFEAERRCATSIGWCDPRTLEGELAWPERFSAAATANIARTVQAYAYAGQYQQRPVPRGGGIIKREDWQLWDEQRYPAFEYVVASLDGAYTEKQENDPSALTLWGFWRDSGRPHVMLIWGWRKWLQLHGPQQERLPDETERAYERRTQDQWGLVEWTIWSCNRFKADLLLIEAKATGITVAQEVQRRIARTEAWGVKLVNPLGDKVARAHAVQPIWANGLVYAPDKDWAEMVIGEVSSFPKGRYDDLTDTCTQAVKHMRDIGLLTFAPEDLAQLAEDMKYRRPEAPLYQV